MNSEDDVSDEDPSELFDTDNVVVCQFDKVRVSLSTKSFTELFSFCTDYSKSQQMEVSLQRWNYESSGQGLCLPESGW